MIWQLIVLFFIVFISPLFPPVVIPFSYSLIAALLLQHANPWLLAVITVGGSALSCIVTWLARIPVTRMINEFQLKRDNKDRLSKIEKSIGTYFSKHNKINTYAKKIEEYAQRPHGKFMFALIVVFLVQSSVPDVIAIKFLHKRISFRFFAVTAVLGKIIVYVPIIFVGMGILEYIRTRFGW